VPPQQSELDRLREQLAAAQEQLQSSNDSNARVCLFVHALWLYSL
jgi:hypothetical protein